MSTDLSTLYYANLIAAAPDLYEALERAAEGWTNLIEGKLTADRYTLGATILRDEALAALAKARGERS